MKQQIRFMVAAMTLSAMTWQPAYAQQAATGTDSKAPVVFRAMILSKLPPEKLAMYKMTIEQVRTRNQGIYDQINLKQDELSPILTAEKFDKVAYMAKVAEIDKLYAQTHTNMTEAMVGLAEKFTPAERKVLDSLHRTRGNRSQSFNKNTGDNAAPAGNTPPAGK